MPLNGCAPTSLWAKGFIPYIVFWHVLTIVLFCQVVYCGASDLHTAIIPEGEKKTHLNPTHRAINGDMSMLAGPL